MAVSGTWKRQQDVSYVGALRWGTGINPVHAIPSENPRGQLNATPEGPENYIPSELVEYGPDHYGYCDEDSSSALWGYGFGTGTADRPGWGTEDDRADSGGFPPYSPPPGPEGTLTGSAIRMQRKGSQVTTASKTGAAMPDAQQGYEGKAMSGIVEDAVVSDPSQYEMQTSMTQRDKVREGSQRGGGSASEFAAPIHSARPTWAQRLYKAAGGERHYDMFPRQQDPVIRGFRFRTAGVGPARNTTMPEGMFVNTPRQRIPAMLPDQGPDVTHSLTGYMPEDDQGWYIS